MLGLFLFLICVNKSKSAGYVGSAEALVTLLGRAETVGGDARYIVVSAVLPSAQGVTVASKPAVSASST